MKKTKPYGISALIYDQLMQHVDYEDWADYIHAIFDKYHLPGKRVIEGGCGTGSLMEFLQQLNYSMYGFDLSFEMVQEAKRKYESLVWQGDFKDFTLKQQVDGFICLYDSIQYLSLEDLPQMLNHVYDVLNTNGLFVFDIVTENHILTYWKHAVDKDETDRFRFTRKSWYDPRKKNQHTEIECYDFISKNAYIEHHIQHIFDLDELIQIIIDSKFCLKGMFSDFSFMEGHPKSDRIHFVLKKEMS